MRTLSRPWSSILILLGLLVALTIPASQNTRAAGFWYVTVDGNDSNSCNLPSAPCKTIAGIIDKAGFQPGDTIYMGAGTYIGNTDEPVISIAESVTVSGGWTTSFTAQNGVTIVDGENARPGILVSGSTAVTIEHLTVVNGKAVMDTGGGIRNQGAALTLNHIIIQYNHACGGAGIANMEGTLLVNDADIQFNETSCMSGGGGLYNGNGAKATINHSLIANNNATTQDGGGIVNQLGELNIFNSAIIHNTGDLVGGILNMGTSYIVNSTISQNSGDGITLSVYGTAQIYSSTIAWNTGTGLSVPGSGGMIKHVLMAANRDDCSGGLNSGGYNLVQNMPICNLTGGSNDLLNVDPKLVTDLSGWPGTYALLPSSPAVNAGDPLGCSDKNNDLLPLDQRGLPRYGRCDIGAYELQPLGFSDITASSPVHLLQVVPYTIQIANPGTVPLTDVAMSNPLPTGLTYVPGSLTASQGTPDFSGNTVSWSGTVNPGESVNVTYNMTASMIGTITNTVTIVGGGETYSRSIAIGVIPYRVYLPCTTKPCGPLFADNFSDPNSGWPVGDYETAIYEYVNGEYRILVKPTEYWVAAHAGVPADDFVVTVDVRPATDQRGIYGLIFGLKEDWSEFYTFEISSDQTYEVYWYSAGKWTLWTSGFSSDIKPGLAVNHLKVDRQGLWSYGSVNGNTITTINVNALSGARLMGVIASSYDLDNVDVRFDNFAIYPMNCAVGITSSQWPMRFLQPSILSQSR